MVVPYNDEALLSLHSAGIFPLSLVPWFIHEYKLVGHHIDSLTFFSPDNLHLLRVKVI